MGYVYTLVIEAEIKTMWVVRDIKTHKVVARNFADKASASRHAEELLELNWRHYEAYPARLSD